MVIERLGHDRRQQGGEEWSMTQERGGGGLMEEGSTVERGTEGEGGIDRKYEGFYAPAPAAHDGGRGESGRSTRSGIRFRNNNGGDGGDKDHATAPPPPPQERDQQRLLSGHYAAATASRAEERERDHSVFGLGDASITGGETDHRSKPVGGSRGSGVRSKGTSTRPSVADSGYHHDNMRAEETRKGSRRRPVEKLDDRHHRHRNKAVSLPAGVNDDGAKYGADLGFQLSDGQSRDDVGQEPRPDSGRLRGREGKQRHVQHARSGGGAAAAGMLWETLLRMPDVVGLRGDRSAVGGEREGQGPVGSETEQVWMMTGRRRRMQSTELRTFPGGAELTCAVKLESQIAEDGDVSLEDGARMGRERKGGVTHVLHAVGPLGPVLATTFFAQMIKSRNLG